VKVLVLAAGKGSRLGAAAGGLPKPLAPVGETSPLEHNLEWVAGQHPERIWINVHQAAEAVRDRIGDVAHGIPVSYSHEPELLGTAGAWKKLASEWTGTSMVIYGDNFMRFDLASLRASHAAGNALATIAIFDPDVHANTGVGGGRVTLDGDAITAFVEGGADGPINAGAYCLEPEVLQRIPAGFSDFGRDVLPGLAADGLLRAHAVERSGYCLGIDTPERLKLAQRMLDDLEAVG
jgi:mannose-1-phosphate guanylyltransferase